MDVGLLRADRIRPRAAKFGMVAAAVLVAEAVAAAAHGSLSVQLSVVLFAACALRVYSLLRSVVWLWLRAGDFAAVARTADLRGTPAADTIYGLYRDSGGLFFPFGVRAIVLEYRKRTAPAGVRQRTVRLAYRLWKYYVFAPVLAILEMLIGFRWQGQLDAGSRALILAAGLLLLVGALIIAAEGILSYVNFGSWSVAYHRLDVKSGSAVSELSAFAGGALTAYVAAAAAIAFTSSSYRSFSAMAGAAPWWRVVGGSFYYALTGFTGNGDAGPTDFPAFLTAGVLYLEGTTFLVVVISLLINSITVAGRPEPPAAPAGETP